jgi:hypothetical protein
MLGMGVDGGIEAGETDTLGRREGSPRWVGPISLQGERVLLVGDWLG